MTAMAGSNVPVILMGLFVAFGGFLYGYDTGTISGILAMPHFIETFHDRTSAAGVQSISASRQSLIVSILSAGTFFGALFGAPTGDFLGRRLGLVFGCLVFCLGVALQTAATMTDLFAAGRFFAGLGVGIISCLVPMYQSESAPKWIRGTIVSCYQLAITLGLLVAAIVNNATKDRDNAAAYRIPIGIQFAWAAVLAGGMLLLPETPRFLVKRGNMEAAAKALGRLRALPADSEEIQEELKEIKANHDYELSLGAATYRDVFRGGPGGGNLRRVLIAIFIQMFQQLTGVNFIFYYGTTFFKNSGIKNEFTISMITNVVNVVSTFPGLYMVEKLGRRWLLIFGACGMAVSQWIVVIVGVSTDSDAANKVLIAFVCLFIAFFACSWGPVAWVVVGEIFPLKTRAKSMSMGTASNWFWNWLLAFVTPYMMDEDKGNLGVKVFFVWGSTCLTCILFSYFFIPETKGLSLEEVDEMMATTTARNSTKYRPSVTTQLRDQYAMDASGMGDKVNPKTEEAVVEYA
ncbi:general substrate transporter [Saitoella complicata NRRL Y-17804]|uniref:general substrate transporter n=1 Tax=Saitoella complicata (strain BCRC 22490 / CBS 7301 / JCM 7358 / NBRC 10748 / NRRL Y-17804) TaxID=698492 RepID=UPI000868036F|nr:general substrate transporter [Saitoella complicata NRRL Y-17804]ODQ54738.1 general substrate transporter [Saitoella complicata NRRL Y-17804]